MPDSLTYWAESWKITRADGTVFAFTSHDLPLEHEAVTYEPLDSLSASASELSAHLGQTGNLELSGLISAAAITERDLLGGLFDGAEIEVWLLPWGADGDVARRIARGTAGNLSHGDLGFTMEVLTDAFKLTQQPLVQTYTPSCRWRFGDARCTVNVAALQVTGAVTGLASANLLRGASRRIFFDTARTEADGYFDSGTLTWTSGNNAGQSKEVKSYHGPTDEIVLWEQLLYAIEVGDEYTLRPGCRQTVEACKGFSNYINFGGFPDVPGRDDVSQAPDAKFG